MTDNSLNIEQQVEKKKKKKKKKKNKKSKLVRFIEKNRFFKALKETKQELKQVTWTTPKQTLKNTSTVIIFSVICTLICYGFDFLASTGLNLLIK